MPRAARGTTLVEVLTASTILVMVLGGGISAVRQAGTMWQRGHAEQELKQQLAWAVSRMAPTVREAHRIEETSTSSMLKFVLPETDPATGGYRLPLQDGATVWFYLSGLSGDPAERGSILWRAVGGVPDAGWSLHRGRGRIDLRTSELSFEYPNPDRQGRVLIEVAVQREGAGGVLIDRASTEVMLRNWVYR